MTTKSEITRKFTVAYQLGARGSTHKKLSAAIRARDKAEKAARQGGDRQRISLLVEEYKDGRLFGVGDFTAEELLQLGE